MNNNKYLFLFLIFKKERCLCDSQISYQLRSDSQQKRKTK